MFLKFFLQNSQGNDCAGVPFLIKLQASAILLKRRLWPGVFLWILRNSQEHLFYRTFAVAASAYFMSMLTIFCCIDRMTVMTETNKSSAQEEFNLFHSAQFCIPYRNHSFDFQCNQMTGFCMKYNTGLKWVKWVVLSTHFSPMSHFYTPWKRQKTFG